MTERTHEVWELALPEGAEGPIRLFVNGTELSEDEDFTVHEATIQFASPLRAQPRLGAGRKIMLAIGIGVYGDLRGDSLDVHYTLDGRPQVLTDLRLTTPRSTEAG